MRRARIRVGRESPQPVVALEDVKSGPLLRIQRGLEESVLGEDQRLVSDRPVRTDDAQCGRLIGQRDRVERHAGAG